ncbi:threonine/serine exporter family protein [Jeongeupia wiesaeckerbachi]|uniref:threonine/serine exporter family protein n=1 Tax=Jeongeupia wiesaeckerbachi TaxID=3051218 RepID=UPI003D8053C0
MSGWLISLWAAPAALGFALLFNAPPRALWPAAILAVVGRLLRDVVMHAGIDITLGTLIAALAIGALAEVWARRVRLAAPVFAISAAIPMVPGVSMYEAVHALMKLSGLAAGQSGEAYLVEAGSSIVRAAMILLALTIGIAMPSLLMRRR